MAHHPLVIAFLAYLEAERRLSLYTVRNYKKAIQSLLTWLKIEESGDLTKLLSLRVLEARSFVIEQQRQFSRRTVHHTVSALRTFYRYLIREKHALSNPYASLSLPKLEKRLPKFLTEKQMILLLDGPQKRLRQKEITPFECARDQLVLELLYGGGLRVSEAAQLSYANVDEAHATLHIVGKGNKERLCPIGDCAWRALEVFKKMLPGTPSPQSPILVQTHQTPLGVRGIQRVLKAYLKLADLPLDMTPHKIRHSYATHLLNRGMDLRVLQKLLGHSSLSATQVYTHLDMHHLKKVHHLAHPRA